MPEVASYEPGTPCWIDLVTPDTAVARAFYTRLFGWDAESTPDSAVPGHTTLRLGASGRVAALMPHPAAAPPGTPALWTTYVSVADVDATAKAAQDAGGRVFLGPMDVPGQGRCAMLFDPQGAHIGLWQPGEFRGASIVGEPATYHGSTLAAGDIEGAKAFYKAMLGWDDTPDVLGRSAIGMVQLSDWFPADVPPHWLVRFAVDDCDAVAARAAQLGGAVTVPPTDIPTGRFAVLTDPQAGRFSILRRS